VVYSPREKTYVLQLSQEFKLIRIAIQCNRMCGSYGHIDFYTVA